MKPEICQSKSSKLHPIYFSRTTTRTWRKYFSRVNILILSFIVREDTSHRLLANRLPHSKINETRDENLLFINILKKSSEQYNLYSIKYLHSVVVQFFSVIKECVTTSVSMYGKWSAPACSIISLSLKEKRSVLTVSYRQLTRMASSRPPRILLTLKF